MRLVVATVAVTVAVGACGDATTTTTAAVTSTLPGATTPDGAVASWLDAVSGERGGEATGLVVDRQVALLVAIETAMEPADLAALLRAGVPAPTQDEYWQSFRESFTGFADAPLADLETGDVTRFTIDGHDFAAVEIAFPTRIGSVNMLASRPEAGGGWRVDLLGTLAPALVAQLRGIATDLPPDEDGDVVREALVAQLPSLRAAAEQPAEAESSEAGRRELEALVRFLAPGIGN